MDAAVITRREQSVLDLLGEQLTHAEIAARLYISVRTVESHVASLRRKLAMPDHRSLVRYATRNAKGRRDVVSTAPLTSFLGRERELEELCAAVESSRLVTAVGPGGVGKTRLVAAGVGRLDRLTRFVDLAPVTDPHDLEDAVAAACQVSPSSRSGPVDALVAALAHEDSLLVLDNCEHLVNAVAMIVERLVEACPRLVVLATSRVRLALRFERVLPVGGLSGGIDGDAVALFVARATAAGSPAPHAAARKRISDICAALGGIPLAVELAAVRLPTLGLEGVEAGLLAQGGLLVGGTRQPARHRSMADTLDWSAALLQPGSLAVLCRLSVLVSTFSRGVAVDIAAFGTVTPQTVDFCLHDLVDHQLVVASTFADGSTGFRFLEPVRQYAAARMTLDDLPARRRHLQWCAVELQRLASEADGDEVAVALAGVAEDVRAALGWAMAESSPPSETHSVARTFGLALFRAGSLREAQSRLESAAAVASDPEVACQNLRDAAAVAKCRVLGDAAVALESDAAEVAETGGCYEPAALALIGKAEMMVRFPGMLAEEPDEAVADRLLARAGTLAPDSQMVRTSVEVVRAVSLGSRVTGAAALSAASAVGDELLVSAALDAAIGDAVEDGRVVDASRLAGQRVRRLLSRPLDPATGLELKDACHVAVFCALGAGDLPAAAAMAQRQQELPFLSEQRDLADEELLAPAALAGHDETVLEVAARFVAEWTGAGRPPGSGRGLAPAAVALTYGLRGDVVARRRWLAVLAELRGVPAAEASRGTGYGEVFDALVYLHDAEPQLALELLTAQAPARRDQPRALYAKVFRQWTSALIAEAAVLTRSPQAPLILASTIGVCVGNPVASTITNRARALATADIDGLRQVAEAFARAGAPYQQQRTLTLLGAM